MSNDTSLPRLDPPPFQVVHLLLYATVCSAFLFAATTPDNVGPAIDQRSAADTRYRQIVAAPAAMLDAANATILILLGYWSYRRMRVWNEPGHWIAFYWLWQKSAAWLIGYARSFVRWIAGINTVDELIASWTYLQALGALRFLPFGVLYLLLACGWRRIANTWPWRIYFASSALWMLANLISEAFQPLEWASVSNNPAIKSLTWAINYQFFTFSPVLLLLALANDLLPNRPRRHWSHWIAASIPLLSCVVNRFPPYVWNFRHPRS